MIITLLILSFVAALSALRFYHLHRATLATAQHAARLVDDYHAQITLDAKRAADYANLTRRLYGRINELEARCYRYKIAIRDNGLVEPVIYFNRAGGRIQNYFTFWPN